MEPDQTETSTWTFCIDAARMASIDSPNEGN